MVRVLRTFRLSQSFALLTVICIALALGRACDWLFIVLGLNYLLARKLRPRMSFALSVIATIFSVLPWLGLGYGGMVAPIGDTRPLPTAQLPAGLREVLSPLYGMGEFLMVLGLMFSGPDLITWPGTGVIRRFSVFAFWAASAAIFLVGGIITALKSPGHEQPPENSDRTTSAE